MAGPAHHRASGRAAPQSGGDGWDAQAGISDPTPAATRRRTRGCGREAVQESRTIPPTPLTARELRDPLLTIAEVAELIGCSDKTVRRWIAGGRLVARKLGGQWRIHPSDYRNLLYAGVPDQAPERW